MSFFTLGVIQHAPQRRRRSRASYDAKLDAIRAEVRSELGNAHDAATCRRHGRRGDRRANRPRRRRRCAREMVAEIKEELQSEMGLLPVHLLRDRRSSFVELYSYDNLGKTNYGTAGYLGHGYFITVKHAVVALHDDDDRASTRKIDVDQGRLPRQGNPGEAGRHRRRRRRSAQRRLGDHQDARSRSAGAARRHARSRTTSPSPIFRLGNDYSKGIILVDRLRRPAHVERPRHLPDRRPSWRLGRRRPRSARRPRRHPDRPDAGRLSLLVHPAAAPEMLRKVPGHQADSAAAVVVATN